MPAWLAPAVAAAGTATSQVQQGNMNRKNREYAAQQQQQQNMWNLSMWNLQNQYNDPAAQRARLEAAGLNPALMYGQSASPGIASPPPQSAKADWKGEVQQIDMMGDLTRIYDLEMKQAQVDNLQEQNKVLQEEALLKKATRETSQFNLGLETELRDVSAESRREGLRKQKTDRTFTEDENLRKSLLNARTIDEIGERILNHKQSRAQSRAEVQRINEARKLLKNQNYWHKIDKYVWENHRVRPGDPIYLKYVVAITESLIKSFEKFSGFNFFN